MSVKDCKDIISKLSHRIRSKEGLRLLEKLEQSLPEERICQSCDGSGEVQEICPDCDGSGIEE